MRLTKKISDGGIVVDIIGLACDFTEYKSPKEYINGYLGLSESDKQELIESTFNEDIEAVTWEDLERYEHANYSNSAYWSDSNGVAIVQG